MSPLGRLTKYTLYTDKDYNPVTQVKMEEKVDTVYAFLATAHFGTDTGGGRLVTTNSLDLSTPETTYQRTCGIPNEWELISAQYTLATAGLNYDELGGSWIQRVRIDKEPLSVHSYDEVFRVICKVEDTTTAGPYITYYDKIQAITTTAVGVDYELNISVPDTALPSETTKLHFYFFVGTGDLAELPSW